ncbi:hypothetical protein INT43_000250 [Umbelopsis isabellina]|uniref:Uncharacterized protein n=1 Tax=Mortierella isabellina TaxID=91625 RepID=A0A8H7PFU0_MORIS|nr:hypothetical protein INT43_000250 [Umbelopsis isabellina]
MSAPPKFFGLIWAFFVNEAVWELFLEGSEAKFTSWAVWQRADYRKRQVIVMQILSALLHENDRREMMTDQQFYRRWLSTESGYEEDLPSAVIIQEVIALLPKQNSSSAQTVNLLSPAFQSISSKTRFLNCFTKGSQIPLTPFDLVRIAICDGQLLNLLEQNTKYPKFCCAALRRYIAQFLILPMETAMHQKIETKYKWHEVFDVSDSDLKAANAIPALETSVSRNGFNFHHPFPDLVDMPPRQTQLPSLFMQESVPDQKKVTIVIRKPSLVDDKLKKHASPASSTVQPNDAKKRKLVDERVESNNIHTNDTQELKDTKDAISPAQSTNFDQPIENGDGKEIKSSPVTPKPMQELPQKKSSPGSSDNNEPTTIPIDEKPNMPSPQPTAQENYGVQKVTDKETASALDVRWEQKLQQFFKDRAHALDGWLDKAIARRVQESIDKRSVVATVLDDVKSLMKEQTGQVTEEMSKELDNAVRVRCRIALGLQDNVGHTEKDEDGKVDDAAGRLVRDVFDAQFKTKESDLADSMSDRVLQLMDQQMDKFTQRLASPMDETIQAVFSRRLLAMEPKLINQIDTRIAELWKSRMEAMSGLMNNNIDMMMQQMMKEKLQKANTEHIGSKHEAFPASGATPTSQDHSEDMPDLLTTTNSRTASSWH